MGEFAYSSDSVYTFSTSPLPIQNQTYVTKVDEMLLVCHSKFKMKKKKC
jgi:hypothetical protein